MVDRTFHNASMPPAIGYEVPPASSAAYSRPGLKPGREGGQRHAPHLTALACLFLLLNLCGARAAHAKPIKRVEKLRAVYALDESVEESDGRLIRRKLLKLLSQRDVKLFLKVIQTAEGGEPNLMVGGCRAPNLKQHPALVLPSWCWYPVKGWGWSKASGNYQLTLRNWEQIAPFLGLRDFSETSQALAALELIRRGGGAAAAYTAKGLAQKERVQSGFLKLLQGDLGGALCLATIDWASSSCSTLPANIKIVYARVADDIRKSEADRPPSNQSKKGAGQSKKGERVQVVRVKVRTPLRSSGHAGKLCPSRTKGRKADSFAGRGKS